MLDTLKRWLGFDPQDAFTKDFFFRKNIIGSISMSIVVIGLEIWMSLSLLKYMIDRDIVSFGYYLSHGYHYFVLLAVAIAMLCYGIHYVRQKEKAHRSWLGGTLCGLFSVISLWFGCYFGMKSFAKSDQTFAFMTMTLFVFCLLIWKPYIGGLFSAAVFFYFYAGCCALPDVEMTYSFQVNIFSLWIVIFMFIISNYHMTIAQAEKDEFLIKQAREDSLTGLLNQNGFDEALNSRLNRGELVDTDRILITNIENFKAYNETYGLTEGDVLLTEFAKRLRGIWKNAPIARLHGDRFAVACSQEGVEENTKQLGAFVREVSLAKRVHMELKVGACAPCETVEITLDNARFACASLHHKAGEILQVYDKDFSSMVEMRQFVIGNIVQAVDQGHIHAYYQPVNDTVTRKVVGFEALARWMDPERGLLMPGSFIGTLEEFRLVPILDKEIVRQAAELLHRKIEAGEKTVPISVNFSQVDFDIFNICDFLVETLDHYQVPHSLIEVEMTESILSVKPELKKQLLHQLHEAGFRVWLDDFGSGYSSLNVLKEFRFDVLKIDMIFMREFGKYEKTKEIVRSIIDLADKLNVNTLTEGVETEEQIEFLKESGCNMLQGFLFSKPMDYREIEVLVREGKLLF